MDFVSAVRVNRREMNRGGGRMACARRERRDDELRLRGIADAILSADAGTSQHRRALRMLFLCDPSVSVHYYGLQVATDR